MALLSKLFWFGLFVAFTLVFVVLFEHGTTNFSANFVKQVQEVCTFVEKKVGRP